MRSFGRLVLVFLLLTFVPLVLVPMIGGAAEWIGRTGDSRQGQCAGRERFIDFDRDGWGECKWFTYSEPREIGKATDVGSNDHGEDSYDPPEWEPSENFDSGNDYAEDFDSDPPCIGDCNDMDGDGRTWNDIDGDGDGLYESP